MENHPYFPAAWMNLSRKTCPPVSFSIVAMLAPALSEGVINSDDACSRDCWVRAIGVAGCRGAGRNLLYATKPCQPHSPDGRK